MTVDPDVPPTRFGRRILYCALAAGAAGLAIVVIQLVWDLLSGTIGGAHLAAAVGHYTIMVLPMSLVAGIMAAVVGSFSRWNSRTGERATAVVAAVMALLVLGTVTFIMLWAPLSAVIQLLWIVVVTLAAAWGSIRTDRTAVPLY